MNFDFTSEQTQLADAVRRFVEKSYQFETRRKTVATGTGTSDAAWSQLVELGLLALPMPEAAGGFDGTAVDLLLVMQELGRGLVAEPFFATVFAAEIVKRSGHRSELLEAVASGSLKLAAALVEPEARHALNAPRTRAKASGAGYVIDGRKTAVIYGAQADRLVVSADAAQGLALFVVDANAPGVARKDHRVLDGQRVADITFTGVEVAADDLLASGDEARAILDHATDYGVALLCAEAIGVMEALNAATLDYAKTRKQFGQPIARFQVLQHRMVDMFVHLEQARSMAYLAAGRMGADATERRRAVSAAKVRVGQAARFIGQQAVQTHGGMGVTDELFAAHLFKRLAMIEVTLGDTDHHLQRFIEADQSQRARAAAPVALQRAA